MNKVKCINGHFFDADKFCSCPMCGGGIGGQSEKRKSRKQVNSIRQSRLDDVDKTALLVDDSNTGGAPTTGKAGGIKWHFGNSTQSPPVNTQSPQEQPQEQTPPEDNSTAGIDQQKEAEKHAPAVADSQTSVASTLTEAVAATGHGSSSPLPKTVAHYEFSETELPTGWLVCVKGVYQGRTFACKRGWNRIGRNQNCYINLCDDLSVSREPQAAIIYDPKQKMFYIQEGTSDELAYLNGEPLTSRSQLKAYDRIEMGRTEFVFIPLCGEQFAWDDYIS